MRNEYTQHLHWTGVSHTNTRVRTLTAGLQPDPTPGVVGRRIAVAGASRLARAT